MLAIHARIRRDLTGFTIGGMQQHEPQVAILPVQGDQPAAPITSSSGCATENSTTRCLRSNLPPLRAPNKPTRHGQG
jgi:hypothetical protein